MQVFLMEACASEGQPAPPPAGPGSQRPDFHLCEVQGHQVALPRLPVDALVHQVGDGGGTESEM